MPETTIKRFVVVTTEYELVDEEALREDFLDYCSDDERQYASDIPYMVDVMVTESGRPTPYIENISVIDTEMNRSSKA